MKINFDSPPAAPNLAGGLAVPYAPAKRQLARWRWRLLVLLVLSPLLLFAARLLYDTLWAQMPGFVMLDQSLVKAQVAGRLVRAAAPGSTVRAGQVVAELSNDLIENEYRLLAAQRQRVLGYVEPRPQASAQLPALRALARHQRERSDALRALVGRGAATQAELDAALARLADTTARVNGLEQEYAMAARQYHVEQPPPPARLLELQTRRQFLKLRATADGTVAQVFGSEGEWINENAEVLAIRPDQRARIEVYVDPEWARYARPGQWATVHFLDGYSQRARVKEVKMTAQRLPADRANPLTVRHHSVIAMLEPEGPLPEAYRIHVLPVNVRFDLQLF
jgi:multidrug resistance efflux pump